MQIEREDGTLIYTKYGNGSQFLLAFHGFGQDKSVFSEWEHILGDRYTIYSFDLFYHGESDRSFSPLWKEEWKQYLDSFLHQEPQIERFSVIGYSLGGRFAIATALLLQDRVNELFLIAPDGIFLSYWFRLATTPGIKSLFKYFMLNPGKLDKLISFNLKVGIINRYIADFVRKEMGNTSNRKRVYVSWNYFKTIGYRKHELYKQFSSAPFQKKLIIGEKDRIILPDKILRHIERMGEFQVECIPFKHHQLIKPEVSGPLI